MANSTNGRMNVYRMGTPFRTVLVESSESSISTVVDLSSGSPFSVQNITPSGRNPVAGDIWLLSNDTGSWTFHRLLDPASNYSPLATEMDIVRTQASRNEFRWQPFDNPRSSAVEVPQGSYIGERRLFETQPNERWLPINGVAVSRHRYRALFELIGTTYGAGDGSTTYNIPSLADVTTSDRGMTAYTYMPMTGGADYTVTTTLATVPGLTTTFSVPVAASYEMEVEATLAIDNTYASAGLPDTEAVLRLNSVAVSLGGFSQSMEFRPTSDGRMVLTGQWKVAFSASGSNTIDLAVSKADATGTVTAVRKNSNMSAKLYRIGGTDAVSFGSAAWYICVE